MTHSSMYEEIFEFAYSLGQQAAKLIVEGQNARWASASAVEEKKNSVDLVTETDQAVEQFIRTQIQAKYPSHKFIGEESYAAGERQDLTDEYTWIVDPIDGTMNFVHSNRFVACSIGVCHKREAVVGVIALPFLGEIFSARVGGGATVNRTLPLPLTGGIPQPLGELRQCMVLSEWGSDRSLETYGAKSRSFVKLSGDPARGVDGGKMCHALRTTGSSACNLALVAAGECDIYWDNGMWAWDVAAGAVILKEAGGFFHGGRDAFAANTHVGDIIMSRRCVAVRPVAATKDETAEQIQKRIVGELYETVEEWTLPNMNSADATD